MRVLSESNIGDKQDQTCLPDLHSNPARKLVRHLGFKWIHKQKSMIKPAEMTTLSQIIEKLRLQRQDNEFLLTPEGFTLGKGKFYQPQDLKIIKTYRFEGESDPADSTILYVMEGNDGTIGYSIDAYGALSNHDDVDYDAFIVKIPIEERDEQVIFAD